MCISARQAGNRRRQNKTVWDNVPDPPGGLKGHTEQYDLGVHVKDFTYAAARIYLCVR